MPGFDRRGPLGEGPRTGRGLGKCGKARTLQSSDVGLGRAPRPGDGSAASRDPGRGAGRGRRGGRSRGRL